MIQKFISPNDLMRTSQETLKQIANEFGKTINANTSELVASIWEEREKEKFKSVLDKHIDYLFAHRGSYVCYKVNKGNLTSMVKKELAPLLNKKITLKHNDIGNEPEIVGVYKLKEEEYLVKVTYLVKYENRIENDDVIKIPIIDQTNVLIDTKNDVVEIRTNFKISRKIINFFHQLDNDIVFENVKIEKDNIIRNLDATMTSSKGYTIGADINLDDEGKLAIERIITFIDNALEDGSQNLEYSVLIEQIDKLRQQEEVNNFVLLLINGLGKLDLGSIFDDEKKEDLNKNSLYNLVKPYLEPNTMYLTVPFTDGVVEYFTINVGLEKNVITYLSTPNEKLIRHIRSKIL